MTMKFSGFAYLVSIHHRSKFQGNLRHKGDILKKELDDLTWNYPFLTGHKFTNFPTFKREAIPSCKKIKMKLTLLKKVSRVFHFTDFFLCMCSVYSHFEFELKK